MAPEQPHANPAVIPTGNLFAHFKRYNLNSPHAVYVADRTNARENAVKYVGGEKELEKIQFLAVVDELRTNARADLLRRHGNEMTHEVASGFSLLGYETSLRNPNHIWVDSEQKEESAVSKRKLLEELALRDGKPLSANLHFEQADVLKLEDLQRTAKHFIGMPYSTLSSGLFAYFDSDNKRLALSNIAQASPRGSKFITVDSFTKELIDTLKITVPAYKSFVDRLALQTKSSMYDWAWSNTAEQRAMFEERFTIVEEVPFAEYSNRLTSISQLPASAGDVLPAMNLAHAFVLTPRK